MKEPVRAFLEDIKNTCVKHGLVLTVSDYDALQVWPITDDSVARLMDAEDKTPSCPLPFQG